MRIKSASKIINQMGQVCNVLDLLCYMGMMGAVFDFTTMNPNYYLSCKRAMYSFVTMAVFGFNIAWATCGNWVLDVLEFCDYWKYNWTNVDIGFNSWLTHKTCTTNCELCQWTNLVANGASCMGVTDPIWPEPQIGSFHNYIWWTNPVGSAQFPLLLKIFNGCSNGTATFKHYRSIDDLYELPSFVNFTQPGQCCQVGYQQNSVISIAWLLLQGSCIADNVVGNSVCGIAARAYASSETAFDGALCLVGTASPLNPSFPAAWGSVSWLCRLGGAAADDTCVATRAAAACNGPAVKTEYQCNGNNRETRTYNNTPGACTWWSWSSIQTCAYGCSGGSCNAAPADVNCVVSARGPWSSCVNGSRTHSRTITTEPSGNGGTACPALTESDTVWCVVNTNCAVSARGPWSSCVNGSRTHSRTITTEPSGIGTACPALTESDTNCPTCSTDCADTCDFDPYNDATDHNGPGNYGCGVSKTSRTCYSNIWSNNNNQCQSEDSCNINVAEGGSLCCANTPTGTCNCTANYNGTMANPTTYQCNGANREQKEVSTNSCGERWVSNPCPSGDICDSSESDYCRTPEVVCDGSVGGRCNIYARPDNASCTAAPDCDIQCNYPYVWDGAFCVLPLTLYACQSAGAGSCGAWNNGTLGQRTAVGSKVVFQTNRLCLNFPF